MTQPFLLHSKLTPPRLHPRVLPRPALVARLREAMEVRLTVVQAGTGYGKSTALAALAQAVPALVWYSVEAEDADPPRFLAYLVEGVERCLSGFSESPRAVLEEAGGEGKRERWEQVVDSLLNALVGALSGPLLLVLDDFHFVADAAEIQNLTERLIGYAPPHLHIVLATRHPLRYASMVRWRARGDLLELGRPQLAFQPAEIDNLFRTAYGIELSAEEVCALAELTEGWPIALQLVWQRLRGAQGRRVAELLRPAPAAPSLAALFDFLACEVYDNQPADIRRFLSETAILRELTPAACDALTGRDNSAALLAHLHNLDLFVIALGAQHFRYHHLFHDFLRQFSADDEALRARHRRAARFFHAEGNRAETIFHQLAAQDFADAATTIEAVGEASLRAGQLDSVAGWIDNLPPNTLAEHPLLQAFLGDLYRLRSRFEEALAWYTQAEQTWRARNDGAGISRALRGQALIFLDTVRPARAESLLEEALRVSDGIADRAARARLLELLAENKLNMGQPQAAEQLRHEARALREEGPGEDVLSVRVKLRTGRLSEARCILERWVERERQEWEQGQVHPPRAHRESVLLLSLIHALMGEVERATTLAREGIGLGEQLGSPFVSAVGTMRLGHAIQLQQATRWPPDDRQGWDEAIACYSRAISLGDQLAVRRTRLEAHWGLTRAYGFAGDLPAAQRAAAEAREIGQWAGDSWVVALADLALGASFVLAGDHRRAVELLTAQLVAFRECGDRFGRAATRLWLCMAYLHGPQRERLDPSLERLFALCESEGYHFLFTRPTLLGPPDPHQLVPLLLQGRALPRWRAYAERLLAELGMGELAAHPGYQLRVQTLGGFGVWRGHKPVEAGDWKRDKARQLFQLLLTEQGRALHREEITERLWPDRAPQAAVRDFKVALTALNKALEPQRSPDAPYAFIVREGTCYALRADADLWLDARGFEQACERGQQCLARGDQAGGIAALRRAVSLFQGPYLPDALYEDWTSERREQLLSLFLRSATQLAGLLHASGEHEACVALCQRILALDPCWEQAYRLSVLAHAALGNRALALRSYHQCEQVLREQLGVAPAPATVALYRQVAELGSDE